MIIRHSIKILEQLTEIEKLIQKIESYMHKEELDIDREKVLLKIFKTREAPRASRDE